MALFPKILTILQTLMPAVLELQNFEARGKPSTVFPRAGPVETERLSLYMWKSQRNHSRDTIGQTEENAISSNTSPPQNKETALHAPTRAWNSAAIASDQRHSADATPNVH